MNVNMMLCHSRTSIRDRFRANNDRKKLRSMLGIKSYVREYALAHFALPRQTGKTTAIAEDRRLLPPNESSIIISGMSRRQGYSYGPDRGRVLYAPLEGEGVFSRADRLERKLRRKLRGLAHPFPRKAGYPFPLTKAVVYFDEIPTTDVISMSVVIETLYGKHFDQGIVYLSVSSV